MAVLDGISTTALSTVTPVVPMDCSRESFVIKERSFVGVWNCEAARPRCRLLVVNGNVDAILYLGVFFSRS